MPICGDDKPEYIYSPITLTINFEYCKTSYKFTIDTDFKAEKISYENVRYCRVFVNDVETKLDENFKVKENDVIYVKNIVRYNSFKDSIIKIDGIKYSEVIKK